MESFDWRKYLNLARFLLNDSVLDRYSNYRNAISRSYFAALNQSKLYALSRQWLRKVDQYNHENIRSAFKNRDSLSNVEMRLKRMSTRRNASDYDTNWPKKFILEEEARMIFSEAEKVFDLLSRN